MFTRVLPTRVLAALTAVPLVIAGCSSTASQSASAPATGSNVVESASVTPLAGPAPMPAAPAPPACGAGSALLASMSTRDKLAQLLMVGVRNAADARPVENT